MLCIFLDTVNSPNVHILNSYNSQFLIILILGPPSQYPPYGQQPQAGSTGYPPATGGGYPPYPGKLIHSIL